MNVKFYKHHKTVVSGVTLKDPDGFEENNMALHSCKSPKLVLENREKLAEAIGCSVSDIVCASQTHGDNIQLVTAADRGRGALSAADAIPDTDALYTYESNLLLCTFSADCVPVIFHDPVKELIGVIHSGWQVTVKEITSKVFSRLLTEEGCQPENLHVQLGPAISQERFEVDEDVYEKFKQLGYADEFIYFNQQTGKYHIDNQLVVKKQCELAGIPAKQILHDRTCTFMSSEGFSYRQDKNCGRHLSFVMRKI